MAENIKEAQSCLRELNKKHEKIVNKLLDIEKYKRVVNDQEYQDAAESRIEQKTASKQRKAGIKSPLTEQYYPEGVARTDIQVGGMKDRKTGLGRSLGISYTTLN